MQFSLLTSAVLLLASFTSAIPSPSPNANLEDRQVRQTPAVIMSCADYSRIANYSAIDGNSTLRAAFLNASPQGTDPTRVILDLATKEFLAKKLITDRTLNAQCGNLSSIALREVGRNFSVGVVGGFKVVPPVGAAIGAGRELWCVGFIFFMFATFGLSL